MRELKRVVCIVVLHTEGDTVMANMLEFDTMPSSADASLALSDMEKYGYFMHWNSQVATGNWRQDYSISGALHYTAR